MNEQIYNDLYSQTEPLIRKHSPSLLNDRRAAASQLFQEVGFPTSKDEAYKYCRLEEQLGRDYGLNINRLQFPLNPAELLKCDVPGIKAHLYYMVNDQLFGIEDTKQSLPEGVILCRLSEACEKHADIVSLYLGKLTSKERDGYIAFNEMFAQDGLFLYVPKGIEIEAPIQIINVLRSDVDLMIEARNLIIMESMSKAKVLVCEHSVDQKHFFTQRLTECFVEDNANLEYYSLENSHRESYYLNQFFVEQKRDSKMVTNLIGLHNGQTRNHIEVNMIGEGAETWLGGMLASDREQQTDNYTVIRHMVPHCNSKELFKYILDDKAVGAFSGLVYVAEGAQKTEAYQTNRNICLTKEARMYARPQLEIYADDVKCGHGATTGQLDETAMFYMRARGIGADEARMLLLLAFTADILEQIHVEPLRDRLRMLIEKRLRGEAPHCTNCVICN